MACGIAAALLLPGFDRTVFIAPLSGADMIFFENEEILKNA
jgi:hypothetical protein